MKQGPDPVANLVSLSPILQILGESVMLATYFRDKSTESVFKVLMAFEVHVFAGGFFKLVLPPLLPVSQPLRPTKFGMLPPSPTSQV